MKDPLESCMQPPEPIEVAIPFTAREALNNVVLTECNQFLAIMDGERLGDALNVGQRASALAEEVKSQGLFLKSDSEILGLIAKGSTTAADETDEFIRLTRYEAALVGLRGLVQEDVDEEHPETARTNFFTIDSEQKQVFAEMSTKEHVPRPVLERAAAHLAITLSGSRTVCTRPALAKEVFDAYSVFTPLIAYYNSTGLILPANRIRPRDYAQLSEDDKAQTLSDGFTDQGRIQNLRRMVVLDFFNMFATDSQTSRMAVDLRISPRTRLAKFLPYNTNLAE